MSPAVISEHLIQRFKFWANGNIQEGMRQGHELYRYVTAFPLSSRQQAYALGINLKQVGQHIIITCSDQEYVIWSRLRSSQAPSRSGSQLAAIDQASQPRPSLMSSPHHPALGKQFQLGSTNHPQASLYQGQRCKVVEVWQRWDQELILTVEFTDGVRVRGVFVCELEDSDGHQISRLDFLAEAMTSPPPSRL